MIASLQLAMLHHVGWHLWLYKELPSPRFSLVFVNDYATNCGELVTLSYRPLYCLQLNTYLCTRAPFLGLSPQGDL